MCPLVCKSLIIFSVFTEAILVWVSVIEDRKAERHGIKKKRKKKKNVCI